MKFETFRVSLRVCIELRLVAIIRNFISTGFVVNPRTKIILQTPYYSLKGLFSLSEKSWSSFRYTVHGKSLNALVAVERYAVGLKRSV